MHSPSPVHFALDPNHANIAQLLIEHGADLDGPFTWDWEECAPLRTFLQRAAKQGDHLMVQAPSILLENTT